MATEAAAVAAAASMALCTPGGGPAGSLLGASSVAHVTPGSGGACARAVTAATSSTLLGAAEVEVAGGSGEHGVGFWGFTGHGF